MVRKHTQMRQVRFNLPLSRQNTIYSESSMVPHIPTVTEEEIDRRDEMVVEDWLLGDGSSTFRSSTSRLHASSFKDPTKPPSTIAGTPGPLPLQLVYSALENLNLLPLNEPISPPSSSPTPSQPPSKLKRYPYQNRNNFTHPDGTPLSFHYSKAFFNDDEQEYVIPASSGGEQEIRIRVTKDWSERKLAKHRDDQLLIYRVPNDDALYFGITVREHGLCGTCVRKPEDDDDQIRIVRHGHPSWDIGYKEEMWYLIGKNPNAIGDVVDQIERIQPTLFTRMKRMVMRNTIHRILPPSLPGILS